MPAESQRRRNGTVKCQRCDQEFSRSEHLTRHLRTHTNDKPHICTSCRKGFSRSDVLNRHYAAHHGPNSSDQKSGPNFRACLPCATARVKCLGSQPCQRCSVKTIQCCYPDAGKSRQHSQAMEGREVSMNGLVDSAPNGDSAFTTPVGSTRLLGPHNESCGGIHSTPSLVPAIEVGQTISQQAEFLSPNGQTIPGYSPDTSSQVPRTYEMPSLAVQSSATVSRDLDGQFQNNDFNSALTGYPSVTPYDFGSLSNQSMEMPELGDYGYSAINWLSPKDLGYSEFDYQAQYFGVDNFNLWAGPIDESATAHTSGDEIIIPTNQSNALISDNFQGNNEPVNTNSVPQIPNLPASTPSVDTPMTCSTPSKSSNYYVDGAGAREPRYGRLRRQRVDWEKTENAPLSNLEADYSNLNNTSFSSSIENYLELNDTNALIAISPDMYKKISNEFHTTQLASNRVSDHEPVYFPSIDIFNMARQLYFEYFHPIFPLIHKSSTLDNTESWLVELAIAAIGINYLGTRVSQQCSEVFIDFLIKCLERPGFSTNYSLMESEPRSGSLHETQARVLCCVAMYHSRNVYLAEKSVPMRSQLVGHCLHRRLLSISRKVPTDLNQPKDDTWQEFIVKETRIRVGYCIFLLDCLIAYQSDFRPQMQLEDARASLPCFENIWEACDEISWHEAYSRRSESPSLLVALESLYKKKTVDPSISEFGRILLIHGLYHRTWEVARYHKDTLSNWIPSVPGTRAPSPSLADPITEWLPRNPIFSKWRNSACDCLDVLHWSANSQIAQRAGLEHPTILHLHLARLILLTPAATIQSLASLILHNSKNNAAPRESSQAQYHEDRSEVLRWFIQDQYKARLALVHAGAIFWHVRRYSHDSMLEPFAVLLATLVVWAYATSSQAIDQQQRQGLISTEGGRPDQGHPDFSRSQRPNKEPENDLVDLPFINLDRLCDDELIQMYVLHGSRMKGFMAGIGDICKEGALVKILREGAKIIACNGTHRGRFLQEGRESGSMAALPTWGIGVRHALFLRDLADASQRRLE